MQRTVMKPKAGGNYFASGKSNIDWIPTGCKTLDLALGGGGWAERRVINIVGDKSSGKTLMAIEASANFIAKYDKGKIRYREAEAAFDKPYALALGMPVDKIDFGDPMETVEDLFEDLQKVLAKAKSPELYIVDSLDALSDRGEMDRAMDQGTYGAQKAKNLSQLFRRLIRQMDRSNLTLIIISQVRSKIGISFGRNTTRSGGRALDFYASQVLYLQHIGQISKTIKGVKRPTGVKIKAKIEKNKCGLPYREAQFKIKFGYGMDDVDSCLNYLKEEKGSTSGLNLDILEDPESGAADYFREVQKLHEAVEKRWWEVETSFMPTRKKYGV